MNIQRIAYEVQQQADTMIQNPKIQAVAGPALVATPIWLTNAQTWLGFFTIVCGAIIGAHGVYRILKPVAVRVVGCLKSRFNKS